MLVSEALERVQSAYSKGSKSDDSRLSNRFIYSKLRSIRVGIIDQKLNKKQVVSNWCYQPIIVEMQEVPKHECPEIASDTCKVLRSKRLIPQIFTNMVRLQVQSITSMDGSQSYTETSWELIKYKNARKYAKDIPEYYFRNGYLYITDKKVLGMVSLAALFNDPIEARKFSDNCGKVVTNCISYLDYDLAIDGKIEAIIIEMTKEQILNDFSGKDDRQNNAVDDANALSRRQARADNNQFRDDE
jgi:hypothetical protein